MIEVRNLIFAYPGQTQPTLKGLSFEIMKGEIFGFLGPSGSGKSTTQKILIGLLKGYSGEASLLGKRVSDWDQQVYKKIGIGFELPNHYNKLSALENLKLFASLYGLTGNNARQRIDQLLKETGLFEARFQTTDEFSKGMKMRLNFARALLPNPEILFLDEPTTGLDPVNAANIRHMIQQHKDAGKTIFLTTHNMHDADELCDRVAFIVEGELKHVDSPRAMKQHYGESTVLLEQRNEQGLLLKSEYALESLAGNSDFQVQLAKYPIETLHSKEATLEDVFIKVTGAQLQ
jgi:fluoroquinolone transport system ATP-binding protein